MSYSTEIREAAKRLYLRRAKPREIQAQLGLPNVRIVYYWIARGGWDELLADEEPLAAVSRRITLLLERPGALGKTELDELDRLTTLRERLLKQSARPAPAPAGESAQEGGPPERRRGGERGGKGGKREKRPKNDVSGLGEVDFLEKFTSRMFAYQQELFAAKRNPLTARIRNVLKSRQIGLTYYFAAEAFMDAVLTGDNQMFLSASRAQSEIFRSYIIAFAAEWFGLTLTGNPIVLSKDGKPWAELRFLSTNSSTAQGHHGHVYIDEYFWIRDFEKLNNLAGAMASHKKWRKTYFSTPSAVSHQAYPFWTGEAFRDSKRGKKLAQDWPGEAQIHAGALCPDGQWRKVITLEDAIAGGCDLFDIERLRLEYDEERFDQLFMCKFIDSTQSAFALADLERCYSDLGLWTDYDPDPRNPRPHGNGPVWLGYDPSRTRDDATCVVVAPPLEPGARFRILEKHSWRGHSFTYQAAQVQKLCERFNVQHIGIDVTGVGYGVFDLVRDFFPRATPIHYSLEAKNALVLKAQDTIQAGRIEWDAGWSDIAAAFLTIKRGATASGQITYSASRTDATGHADVAWAIMHALANEPLNTNRKRRSRWSILQQDGNGHAKTAPAHTRNEHPLLHLRRAGVRPGRQPGRVPGRVRQRRRAPLHPAGVAHRAGQAAAGQRPSRDHSPLQAQPAAARLPAVRGL
ncbi:terminase large subunit domain-containing protein [Azotobacter vinelandii]|uniref:terminase large subunit domain-containing protein n=1 Tax=Azotobacter vinelandii TaxID=354 RepID=UPI002666070C|nr:terminase family protein [Azotobacter vinelandii]WKN21484.1 terminase family protein [Azotobacter vinelandii]